MAHHSELLKDKYIHGSIICILIITTSKGKFKHVKLVDIVFFKLIILIRYSKVPD